MSAFTVSSECIARLTSIPPPPPPPHHHHLHHHHHHHHHHQNTSVDYGWLISLSSSLTDSEETHVLGVAQCSDQSVIDDVRECLSHLPGGMIVCGAFFNIEHDETIEHCKESVEQRVNQLSEACGAEVMIACVCVVLAKKLFWFTRNATSNDLISYTPIEKETSFSNVVFMWSKWSTFIDISGNQKTAIIHQQNELSRAKVVCVQGSNQAWLSENIPSSACHLFLPSCAAQSTTKISRTNKIRHKQQSMCDNSTLSHPFTSVFVERCVEVSFYRNASVNTDTACSVSAPALISSANTSGFSIACKTGAFVALSHPVSEAIEYLRARLHSQISNALNLGWNACVAAANNIDVQCDFFMPCLLSHPITCWTIRHVCCALAYNASDDLMVNRAECDTHQQDSYGWSKIHTRVCQRFMLEIERNSLSSPMSMKLYIDIASPKHLFNVHRAVAVSGLRQSRLHLVRGAYAYHHYLQDQFNDKGWGCAYRSLQTLWSWLRLQHYTNLAVPSHHRIQTMLVELDDKPNSFVGSNKWIGALELSMILQTIGVTAKIMHLTSGTEFASRGRDFAHHFDLHGSPVMIGGGVLAYTCLGVDFDSVTSDVRFLILDPHYTGGEDIKTIIKQDWCAWHSADIFESNSFYNVCLPQR